jgi:predicted phage terminase large subunit-like protein
MIVVGMMNLKDLRFKFDKLTPKQKSLFYSALSDQERVMIAKSWAFLARKNQLAPDEWNSDKPYWVIVSGRGYGKTRTGAETTLDHIEELGSQARVALIASISSDARDVMIEGESGLLACAQRRGIECTYEPSKRRISFKNGAVATSFTAEEPNRLRGPQHTFAWCDELSSWKYDQETWDMMMFGLRLGPCPKVIITTTPKPRRLMRDLLTSNKSVITRGSTYENRANLAPQFLKAIEERFEGTRLGRQEIYGDLLEDNPDALWQPAMIEATRIHDIMHIDDLSHKYNITRIVVAVDPAVTSGDNADETGVVVAAKCEDGTFLVLDDQTCKLSPDQWGRLVVDLYHKWNADRIIGEANQGGDLIESLLRNIDRSIPYRSVRATKGKRTRAEPISALYEQGKVRHVGCFDKLEDQMCMFTADNFDGSPDRVDALVWALTELSASKKGGISFI